MARGLNEDKEGKSSAVRLRVSGREHDEISAAAKAADLTMSAFVRSLALEGAGVEPFLTREDRLYFDLIRDDLRKIGTNLNQVARAINSGRVVHNEEILITLRNVGAVHEMALRTFRKAAARAGNRRRGEAI